MNSKMLLELIYSTVFASHRLCDEGAHEVKREGAVPGTVGSHTKSHVF